MKPSRNRFSVLLSLLLTAVLLSGCMFLPVPLLPLQAEPISEEPVDSSAGPGSDALTESSAEPEPDPHLGPMPANAVPWQDVFFTKTLPADGWVAENEVCFYLEDGDGVGEVTVMSLEELEKRSAERKGLTRSLYFEDRLEPQYQIVFTVFDMALELGSRRFAFPSRELTGWNVTDILQDLKYTYQINTSSTQVSSTKEYNGAEGSFHFLTFTMNYTDQEDMIRYRKAVSIARSIVERMPEGLDQLEKAKYLYKYTVTHIRYDYDDYYEDEDWGALYDALAEGLTVCSGYSEALCCLFNLAGIECLFIPGWVQTDTELFRHAWNIAEINGSWYVFDATWDATAWDDGVYRPMFFGLSDAAMDAYTRRDPDVLLEPLLPVCSELLDPEYLYMLPSSD